MSSVAIILQYWLLLGALACTIYTAPVCSAMRRILMHMYNVNGLVEIFPILLYQKSLTSSSSQTDIQSASLFLRKSALNF